MDSTDKSQSQTRPPPASITGKRKRGSAAPLDAPQPSRDSTSVTVQIIAGSYERVLHGITASVSLKDSTPTTFSNNFLFNAHSSSIRCVAVSPSSGNGVHQSSKRILATGSSDERINLYQISCVAPSVDTLSAGAAPHSSSLPLLTTGSAGNRELGSLLHHNSAISALHFLSRSKLLSASLDNNIAITRVRDWTVLETIHAPIPKPAGRPSGDTAGIGDAPAGINAVAIHPSAKLCLSVGQGERCMRLWNLVTGKKAGVLTFDKSISALLGEGRWRGGEGRQVVWSADGEEFAVGFEKGAVVYGLDCTARGLIKLPGTKLCQIKYLPPHASGAKNGHKNVLVVGTDDGRILLYNTDPTACQDAGSDSAVSTKAKQTAAPIQVLKLVASVGSNIRGARIKDFDVLALAVSASNSEFPKDHEKHDIKADSSTDYAIITGSSDGSIRLWRMSDSDIGTGHQFDAAQPPELDAGSATTTTSRIKQKSAVLEGAGNGDDRDFDSKESKDSSNARQIGKLLGTFDTRRRITCLTSFVMDDASPATQSLL